MTRPTPSRSPPTSRRGPNSGVGRGREELRAAGRALRDGCPRSSQGRLAGGDRGDPIDLIQASDRSRLPELVPVRYGRMLRSPFSFYRGMPLVMASDLSATPSTGIKIQLCGDAHLLNFGTYATPERNVIFDRQRLRRDPRRAVGVGHQATGGERRGRRPYGRAGGCRRDRCGPTVFGCSTARRWPTLAGAVLVRGLALPHRHRRDSSRRHRTSGAGPARRTVRRPASGPACRRCPS